MECTIVVCLTKMFHKIIIVTIALCFQTSLFSDMKAGEILYKKRGCIACHTLKVDSRRKSQGPAISTIKKLYGNDKAALVKFLQGKAEPRVDKSKFFIMKAKLRMIKNLPLSSLESIADFYLKEI